VNEQLQRKVQKKLRSYRQMRSCPKEKGSRKCCGVAAADECAVAAFCSVKLRKLRYAELPKNAQLPRLA
jgi:hypothetical protein